MELSLAHSNKVSIRHYIFHQTGASFSKLDEKSPTIDFQSQISMSNIEFIHLKMIFYLEFMILENFALVS